MSTAENKTRTTSPGGFSVMELIVAIALTATFTATVFAVWTRINVHMYSHQRTTALRSECGRILGTITNQLRCSQAIIRWDNSSVRFVSSSGSDTIEYSFNGSTLERKDAPLSLIVPQAAVSVFSIENLNNEDGTTPYLFQITVTILHANGVSATERSTVLARRLSPQSNGNDMVW